MGNVILKGGGKILLEGGKGVAKLIAPDLVNLGAKIGTEIIDKQKNLIKIPDLKDVNIEEAIRMLKEELNLIPTAAIANPSAAYADEGENEVMYSEPKVGSRVDPKTPVKLYYLTQDVIEKSKELMKVQAQVFQIPRVIGVNIYEAREDLEVLGLKVTEKIEKPNVKLCEREEGQVTRITYPNDEKVGTKFKTGERVWLYYVTEEVIYKSREIKEKRAEEGRERVEKIEKVTKDISKGLYAGAVGATQTIATTIGKPFRKGNKGNDITEDNNIRELEQED